MLPPDDNPALVALERLQASVRERNVDLERWERENAAERDAAACRPPGKPENSLRSIPAR